jgi:hypothetical protein
MKLTWPIVMIASALMALPANAAAGPWDQPVANLAEQIAGILGPGQARLTIRNLSTISNGEIPSIRLLLEQDLKTHGVLTSGDQSANAIRITLSENLRERLWVAEVVEGNETRVAMVHVEPGGQQQAQAGSGLTLRSQTVLTTSEPVLAALETASGLVVVEPEEIVIYTRAADGWREQKRVGIGQKRPLARDPRAVIFPTPVGEGFEASLPGTICSGSYQPAQPEGEWTIRCHESDDPWSITHPAVAQSETAAAEDVSVTPIKAFYNAARDYFTGVINSSLGVDLPPFYSAAQVVRSASSAPLLINGIDGKVQIADNGALKPVAGTRDWGSDFAALRTSCGEGMQIVASGSGEAVIDSLRAYDLPAQEAVSASAPLTMEGTVTALWAVPDGKSIFAVVRDAEDKYEVDRVTASCND